MKLAYEERGNGNEPPDNLRNVDHKVLKQHAANMNWILKYISTKDITEMSNLVLAAGRVVQLKVGMKRNKNGQTQESLWKRRLWLKTSGIRTILVVLSVGKEIN